MSISVTPKNKRGRPATGKDPVRTLRLPDEIVEAVEIAAADQNPPTSRSELIRQILAKWLRSKGYLPK
jgi:Arc/MetJ-type ribon-helix-helix transcriptional regulator